jgi:hypothetical protein
LLQYTNLEPIIGQTTARCRRYKIWFAGNGFMRMQCKIGGKGKDEQEHAATITWSCVQINEERTMRENAELQARFKKEQAEGRKQQEEMDQENRRKAAKEAEDNRKAHEKNIRRRATRIARLEDGDTDNDSEHRGEHRG